MNVMRIFSQHLRPIEGSRAPFSGEFIRWLQSLIAWAELREWEADLGSTPVRSGSFTITDGAIKEAHKIIITQAPGPYTGKGTRADESEMDALVVTAKAADGSATAYWNSDTFVTGNVKFHYRVS